MSEAPTTTRPRTPRLGRNEPAGPGIRLGGRRIEVAPHHCFACGTLNEHGLQLALHAQDGRCWTELRLPRDFEGWDGIAHGGIVCSVLDEVMAWATIEHDAWGLTARLSVDFRKPVPVEALVRGEGWVEEARKRVIRTRGRIVDVATGTVLATAEATYVAAAESRRDELRRRYAFRLVDEVPTAVEG